MTKNYKSKDKLIKPGPVNTFYKSLIIVTFVITVLSSGAYLAQAASGFLDTVAATLGLHVEGNAGIEDNLYVGEKLGVGTVAPTESLDVVGKVKTSDGVMFGDGSLQETAYTGSIESLTASLTAGEAISAGDAVFIAGVGGFSEKVSQELNNSNNSARANILVGQTFNGVGTNIAQLSFYMRKKGLPSGNMAIKIHNTLSGEPSGTEIAVITYDVSALNTSYAWHDFDLSSVLNIVEGNTYAITITCSSCTDGNEVEWRGYSSSAYAQGNRLASGDGGASWIQVTSQDMAFKVYGSDFTSGSAYKSDEDDVLRSDFFAIAETSAVAGEDFMGTLFGLNTNMTNLEKGSTYYLSSTPGGISTTVSSVEVGKAFSDVLLFIQK